MIARNNRAKLLGGHNKGVRLFNGCAVRARQVNRGKKWVEDKKEEIKEKVRARRIWFTGVS